MRSRTSSECDWMQCSDRNDLLSAFRTISGFTDALEGIQGPEQMNMGIVCGEMNHPKGVQITRAGDVGANTTDKFKNSTFDKAQY